ncbi:hypothetical protein [Nostoc sp.]|uniref:hypothetical protein n=1 Tax=Nostoc sp. TaxID=1180 RepID=UPI002FF8909C
MGRSRSVFLIAIKFTTTLGHPDAEAVQVCDRVVQNLSTVLHKSVAFLIRTYAKLSKNVDAYFYGETSYVQRLAEKDVNESFLNFNSVKLEEIHFNISDA